MQDTFTRFYAANNNTSVEVEDSSAFNQCMDLAFKWCDTLNIPRSTIRHQFAYQIWSTPTDETRKYFDLIPNSATNKPSIGDIVVFTGTTGIPVGHVALETGKSDTMNAITFDQNWDTLHYYHIDPKTGLRVPYCRTVVHTNYYGVVGWLHPKTPPLPLKMIPSDKILAIRNGPGSDGDKLNAIVALCT